MIKKRLLFCLLAIIILPSFASKTSRAFRNLEKQNYERAKELFNEAKSESSYYSLIHFGLAKIYFSINSPYNNMATAHFHISNAVAHIDDMSVDEKKEMRDENINTQDFYELRDKIEASLLNSYLEKGSIEDLNAYISKYPNAANLDIAAEWRNKKAFEKAHEEGTAKAYAEFMEKYPDADQISLAEKQKSKLAYIELLEKQKELDKALNEKIDMENMALKAETKEHKSRISLLIVIICVVLIFLAVSIFSFIKIKRANIAIKEQKNTIEDKNKQILDSIRYAKFIQDAILPKEEILKTYFSDAFIFFRPKDIVSGDFYWFAETEDKIMVAAVDCTGHGVPGAFMSMIGHTLLNQIVHIKNIHTPNEILFELRKEVIKSLNQKESDNYSRDGMDMALIAFSKKDRSLEFSGAYNPLYMINNKKLVQVKADRQPIAIHFDKTDEPFTNHKISLTKGDSLFIFSDGYADQFGGPKDKKYSYKKFREDLENMDSLTCPQQKDLLEKNISEWMGSRKPVDDMLVIGLKI